MSLASRLTGKNLWVAWVDAQGTVVASGDQTSFDPDFKMDTVDMSAGSDNVRSYLPTLKDLTMKLERFILGGTANVGTATLNYRMREGAVGTILWAPEGTATGFSKWGIVALVSDFAMKFPFDDKAMVTIELKPQGADLLFDGRKDAW